jgi:preprotein translocase subunit SecD
MKRSRIIISLIFLVLLVVGAAFVCLPNGPYLNIRGKEIFKKEIKIKEGLDLQGGAHLVYSVDLSKTPNERKKDAVNSLQKVIENRVNAFGVAEAVVQTSKVAGEDRLIVEMPGIKDTSEAMKLIGATAKLDFRELNAEGTDFVKTNLEGSDLKGADVSFDQSGKPQIDLQFNDEGAKKFEEITGRNVGKPLATFLDDQPLQQANVQQQISGGRAVITGQFDIKEAKSIAIQLNAGALPVSIKLVEERSVGATLGRESIARSIYAGIIGIILVSLFMLLSYRLLGVFSTIGLGLYMVFMIALVKLFGITLTMGGVAGLILSVGMSMETDVLVFERIREELRAGKTFATATRLGFTRAWPSVRDSNAVSLIIAALLYTAGGTVRGFAVVLALGIVVGLATTFFGTRTLISLAMRFKKLQNPWLFSLKKEEVGGAS